MQCTNCAVRFDEERHSLPRHIEHKLPNGLITLVEVTIAECPACSTEHPIDERVIDSRVGVTA